MATDQTQVIATAGDLLAVGARRGAAQVLFNATLIAQREAADGKGQTHWTPWGPLPCNHRVAPRRPDRPDVVR